MILINGEAQEMISATDRGLHYGDGVFETIAICNGKARFWQAHMERLLEGCSRLGIPLPDVSVLVSETARIVEGAERAVLKIIITRGSGGRGYRAPISPEPQRILLRYPWPHYSLPEEGITLCRCQTPVSCNPALAGIKHLNRLEQVLARQEWTDESVHEGVMCNTKGEIVEGTMSNLFAVRDGVLLTPDVRHCGVDGVMRRQVLALVAEQGISVEDTAIRPEQLSGMDEVFITNSIIGIWPVARFEDRVYGKRPITDKIDKALTKLLERE